MEIGMKFVILCAMFFCHIFDDYYLQGILASMKQKNWWKENAPDAMYSHDYYVALVEHSFSWSFSISIPLLAAVIAYGSKDSAYLAIIVSYLINTAIHAIVDNLKANERTINLITDQAIHGVQVLLTWIIIANIL